MIKVKICRGTVCHVMGGSDLPLISEVIPPELKSKVEIEGISCLDYCSNTDGLKPPFVIVNEHVISEATMAKVLDVIITESK